MRAHRRTRTIWLLTAGIGLFLAGVGKAGVAKPEQMCSTSADCAGCDVCKNAVCGSPDHPVCRCDGECQLYGYNACKLHHPEQPLCGGACIEAKAASEFICGAGVDVWAIETSPAPIEPATGGAVISTESIAAEASTWTPVADPQDGSGGACSMGSRSRSMSTVVWPLLLGLALLRRRGWHAD